jgi:hypothetical protein
MDTEKSDAALLEVARHPRHLGAEIGFFSVFHTWNPKARASPLCPDLGLSEECQISREAELVMLKGRVETGHDEFLRRFLLRLLGRTTKYVIPGQLSRPGPSGHLGEIHFLVVRKRGSLGLVRFALVLHGDFACPPNHERTTEIRHQILKLARTLDGLEDDLQFGSHEIPTRADWGLPPEERVPSTPSFCFAMNW